MIADMKTDMTSGLPQFWQNASQKLEATYVNEIESRLNKSQAEFTHSYFCNISGR